MIFDALSDLNWLAVIVATIVWFAFSGIWYSAPPISEAWQREARVTASEGPPLATLLIPTFVGYLVTTIVIAMLARAIGATDFVDGLALGVALGIGFGVVGALVNQLFEQKGPSYWLINGANAVIGFAIVAVIVSLWD